MIRYKPFLLAGASVLVLASYMTSAVATDLLPSGPTVEVPPPPTRSAWTWWVEGGGIMLDGDPGVAGMNNPPFDVNAQHWGWEAAGGFDYRGPRGWVWSGQFRWIENDSGSAKSNNPFAVFNIGTAVGGSPSTPFVVQGSNSAKRDGETHWAADFMVGRDVGLGGVMPDQLKIGVRVAEIEGKTTGSAFWQNVPVTPGVAGTCASPSPPSSYCIDHRRQYRQTNRFVGVGPRVEADGSIPLGGRWSIDYEGGVAGLFGPSTARQNVIVTQESGGFAGVAFASGGPIQIKSSETAAVFNLDAMAGLSFAFGPNSKLTASYFFDGYWDALRGFDSRGKTDDLDRFYHGPVLRFTIMR